MRAVSEWLDSRIIISLIYRPLSFNIIEGIAKKSINLLASTLFLSGKSKPIQAMKNYQQKSIEPKSPQREFKPKSVTDYMTAAEKLITFHPKTEIGEVVEVLLEKEITGAPVLNDQHKLVGLIDDKDCLKVLFDIAYHNQPVISSTVSDYMTNVMKTISVHANIVEVADTFLNTKYKRLLVVDDKGKLQGQISRQDILRAIRDFNANV